MEHGRADRAGGRELLVNRQLLDEDRLDVGREREDAALVVFVVCASSRMQRPAPSTCQSPRANSRSFLSRAAWRFNVSTVNVTL